MKALVLPWVGCAALLALAACGGDSGDVGTDGSAGATEQQGGGLPLELRIGCEIPEACGGDFSGTWTFVRGCIVVRTTGACPEPFVTQGRGEISGTLTLSEDYYEWDSDVGYAASLGSDSCDCTTLMNEARTAFGDDVQCGDMTGSACSCGTGNVARGRGRSGELTVVDDALDLGDAGVFDYCVDGDRLTLFRRDAEPPDLELVELSR